MMWDQVVAWLQGRRYRVGEPLGRLTGWFRGRFGRVSRQDATDFAKVLAAMILDPSENLSGSLLRNLRETEGWPHDLGKGEPNEAEQLCLDLWAVRYALVTWDRKRVLTPQARDAFLYEVEEFVYLTLIESGAPPAEVEKLSLLYQRRFVEYTDPFQSFWKGLGERPTRVNFDLVRAITGHLFGTETDSYAAALAALIAIRHFFLSFLAPFFSASGLHMKVARALSGSPETMSTAGGHGILAGPDAVGRERG
jgi:hypothetical protein